MLSIILRLNSLSCLIFGIIMTFYFNESLKYLGTKEYQSLIFILGLVLLFNSVHLVFSSFRKKLIKGEILYFSLGDFIWVVLTFLLVTFTHVVTTQAGINIAIAVAIMVLVFSILQYKLASELPMDQISVAQTLKISKSKAWQNISNFKNIHKIHPMVKEAVIIGELDEGLGAKRLCTFNDDSQVREEVIGWQEGVLLEVEIKEMNMPIKYLANKIELDQDNITTTTTFKAKNLFAEILIGFIMRPLLVRRLQSVNSGFNKKD